MQDQRSLKTLVEDLTEAVILREVIRNGLDRNTEAPSFAIGYMEGFLVQLILDEAGPASRGRIMQRVRERLEVVAMQIGDPA